MSQTRSNIKLQLRSQLIRLMYFIIIVFQCRSPFDLTTLV